MNSPAPILYLEGASGIAGDMFVAALLGLGAGREKLDTALRSLGVDGLDYAVREGSSHGIAGISFDVSVHGTPDHEHEHEHEHHRHHHEHRNLDDVFAVIDRGEMSPRARELAKRIFTIVAEAEAAAHGCPVNAVHFHEVGAIDSIADIVAAAVLWDDLGVTECVVPALAEGEGTVHCQHGELPVPVPAVLNIAQRYGIALRPSGRKGEMVTPTGIAIAAALRTTETLPEAFRVRRVGVGLGKRDFGAPNILRAMLIEKSAEPEKIRVLESNIDDASGEALGLAMERLLAAGARDVHFLPCFMKKNRPATLLRVIADAAKCDELEQIIFECTTTIGIRRYPVERSCMERTMIELDLPMGKVAAKRCVWGDVVRCYPEFESVKALAAARKIPFAQLWQEAQRAADAAAGR